MALRCIERNIERWLVLGQLPLLVPEVYGYFSREYRVFKFGG
jgi:hypothetical protein